MTNDEATALLATTLHEIAPEVDLGTVESRPPLPRGGRHRLDGLLEPGAAIHDRTGIEIPFRDYPRLSTLKLFVSYLMSASSAA